MIERILDWLFGKPKAPNGWDHRTERPIYADPTSQEARREAASVKRMRGESREIV